MMVKTNLKLILEKTCFRCFQVTDCTCVPDEAPPTKKRRTAAPRPSPLRIKVNAKTPYSFHTAGVKLSFYRDEPGRPPVTLGELHDLMAAVPAAEYRKIFPEPLDGEVDLTDYCFIHALPVLPTASRPPNFSNGSWQPDSLTRLYLGVLKASDTIRMKRGVVPPTLLDEFHQNLQGAVNILFDIDNTYKDLKQNVTNNGGIRQRIDGKGGRIRQNLMGKRVEFSARTVLSGDPRLGINEVGVPLEIAQNLTVPVMVTAINIATVRKWHVRYIYKGAQRFDCSVNPNFLRRVAVGDKVERTLMDGDIVAVNRQPTLHRGSMLACYARIFPTKTFRLNYSTMVTLNADTDGDEINIHVPQDPMARAELEELMLASTNIVCSQGSRPLVGCTQDSLLGCYQLSRATLDWKDYMGILNEVEIYDQDVDRRDYRGTEVMDAVLVHLGVNLGDLDIPKSGFVMRGGKVIRGVFDKGVVGAADNSVIHHIFLSYGHAVAAKFIHMMQTAATAFLDMDGFSVGVGDCVVPHEPLHDRALEAAIQKDQQQGIPPDEELLAEATGAVIRLEAPEGCTSENNRLLTMIQSGAKGSMVNFNQITRAVGQQTVGASRVPLELKSRRTLPHFPRGDRGLYAGGYVPNSYVKGLRPEEFFFHAMGGRIGLIDTSCKTADTGAQYRRLVKVLELATIKDDGQGGRMVVNGTTGQVISFNYGEDNFDGTYLKKRPRQQAAK
jgi:DNA-directed RNA polymerase II subunit RPB1